MYYDFAYAMEEAMSSVILSLIMNAGSSLMSIAVYVFTSLSLYTIAKRREIKNPWMAWVPVANCWLIGSIADQYRYVAKGETKNKRKVLLILDIINVALVIVFFVSFTVMMVDMVMEVTTFTMDEEELLMAMMGSLVGMMSLVLPMVAVSIAYAIVYYMALYDIYESCDPNNKTLYLVVGIFVGIAQAIFLFICRNKDGGMPPRKDSPKAQVQQGQSYEQQYGQSYQQQYQAPYQPQYQAPYQPQYQAPYQPQYQAPYQHQYQPSYQSQYQAPYRAPQAEPAPQQAQPVISTEELKRPQEGAPYRSPYGDFPDPYAPQHPENAVPEQ